MKYTTMLRLVYLIPFVIFSIKLSAQGINSNVEKINQTRLDFEKQAYAFQDNDSVMAHVLLNKVYFLKSNHEYHAVIKTTKRALSLDLSVAQKNNLIYELALSYYQIHELVLAEQAILPLLNGFLSDDLKSASTFLYVIILNDLGRWAEAKSQLLFYFNNGIDLSDSSKLLCIRDIEWLYGQDNIPPLKKLKKARTLSLIFPGLGQYYNGNIGAGLLNVSLVGLSGLFAYYNYIHQAYFTGSLGGLYLISTFYFGGVNQLNDLVLQKNKKRMLETNARLNIGLSNLFKQ